MLQSKLYFRKTKQWIFNKANKFNFLLLTSNLHFKNIFFLFFVNLPTELLTVCKQ